MTGIHKTPFPLRLSIKQVERAYDGLEFAFAARDYFYVARFSGDNHELRGCALLMLGNRVGGERILDQNKVVTGRSCFYRANAAWQDDDIDEALRWLQESRKLGYSSAQLQKLEKLIGKQSFRILCHWDIHNPRLLKPFQELPGIEVLATRQLPPFSGKLLPFGQSLASVVPEGKALDLVILDDLKMVPVGVAELGAPVVAVMHDTEWYYELLNKIVPEIDLMSVGSSSEIITVARLFNVSATGHFFPLHMELPDTKDIASEFARSERKVDLYYSGLIGHDFYRYKKQDVLELAQLDHHYQVKIIEEFLPPDQFWQEMRGSRFTIMSSRACNDVSTRAIESVASGTFHLVDENNAVPYIFSEKFACFPLYDRTNVVTSVAKQLRDYDGLRARFKPQLQQFEVEFNSMFPRDDKKRALRYLRHLLFMTHVECAPRAKSDKSQRKAVYINEYDRLAKAPYAIASEYIKQLPPSQHLRRAYALRSGLAAQKIAETEIANQFGQALKQGLEQTPHSMALHFNLALNELLSGNADAADQMFEGIINGNYQLDADDPLPIGLGRLNSFYWLSDARIREMCKDTAPLVSMRDVWISMAWGNRAQIALDRKSHVDAVDYARRSLGLFPYNEDVQKIYLRAVFGLSESSKEWASEFLNSFDNACHNDETTRHDFAAPAYHLLMQAGRKEEAKKLLEQVGLFLARVKLGPQQTNLYEEFVPFMRRYGISHAKLPVENR